MKATEHHGESRNDNTAITTTINKRTPPWQYPLWGILYLWSSPTMIGNILGTIIFGCIVAVMVLVILFTWTLTPQVQAFGGGEGGKQYYWWSYPLAIIAILFEATVLSILLLKVMQSKIKKTVFVQTMRRKGQWTPKMIEPSTAGSLWWSGKDIAAIPVGILTLPLNVIFPIVGTIIYAYLNASFTAWEHLEIYMNAKHMNYQEQRIEIMSSTKMKGKRNKPLWAYDMEINGEGIPFQQRPSDNNQE